MSERVVFKYPVDGNRAEISTPPDPIVRHIAVQRDRLCAWIEHDVGENTEIVTLIVVGTGHPFTAEWQGKYDREHVGTVLMDDGALVWHVYQLTPFTSMGDLMMKLIGGTL